MAGAKNPKRPEMMIAPGDGIETVVPSDSANLAKVSLAIYVGGTGDISAVMADGTTAIFKAVPVAAWLPIQVQRVNSTGTTASLMVSIN